MGVVGSKITYKYNPLSGQMDIAGASETGTGGSTTIIVNGTTSSTVSPPLSSSLPAGGTYHQILAKRSSTNYDAAWVDPPTITYQLDPTTTGLGITTLATYADIAARDIATPPAEGVGWYLVSDTGWFYWDGGAWVDVSLGTEYDLTLQPYLATANGENLLIILNDITKAFVVLPNVGGTFTGEEALAQYIDIDFNYSIDTSVNGSMYLLSSGLGDTVSSTLFPGIYTGIYFESRSHTIWELYGDRAEAEGSRTSTYWDVTGRAGLYLRGAGSAGWGNAPEEVSAGVFERRTLNTSQLDAVNKTAFSVLNNRYSVVVGAIGITVDGDSKVGIGYSVSDTPAEMLDVNGNVVADSYKFPDGSQLISATDGTTPNMHWVVSLVPPWGGTPEILIDKYET